MDMTRDHAIKEIQRLILKISEVKNETDQDLKENIKMEIMHLLEYL